MYNKYENHNRGVFKANHDACDVSNDLKPIDSSRFLHEALMMIFFRPSSSTSFLSQAHNALKYPSCTSGKFSFPGAIGRYSFCETDAYREGFVQCPQHDLIHAR